MTKHLTMNTIIHAAFRRDMKRFDAALAVFSPGDKTMRKQSSGRHSPSWASTRSSSKNWTANTTG